MVVSGDSVIRGLQLDKGLHGEVGEGIGTVIGGR